jgi:hypothetical protein
LDLTFDNGLRSGEVFRLLGGDKSIAMLGTKALVTFEALVSGESGAVESKSKDFLGFPPGTSRLALPDEVPFKESCFRGRSCLTNEVDLL